MTDRLVVWLHDRPVADLEVRRRDLQLTYREDVLAAFGVGALCLSVPLPLQPRPYRGDSVRYWCEGLLPEGETRTVLEAQFGIPRGDTFALLAAIGRDCAGAVTFLSETDRPQAKPPGDTLDDDALITALDELPTHPLGADDDVRVSLGGMQAKLLLVKTADGWARPGSGAPSTHIVKPDPLDVRMQGLVAAEALVMRAAALSGLATADVDLADWGGRRVLVVRRYDRRVDRDGFVVRLHQEDGAQALGLDPGGRRRYQSINASSPTYARLAEVLRDHASDVDAQWVALGASMTVNVAVGNTDAHVRNHSFLHSDGTLSFAPLYDAAPTALFTSTRELGLWVNGQAQLLSVTRSHLADEMASWGVRRAIAVDLVERVLTGIAAALPVAGGQLAVPEDVVARTASHVARLASSA